MIGLGADDQSRSIIGYAKEIYINTETRVMRIKQAKLWLNADGSEFKREERSLIFTDSAVHHYEDTGEVDGEGNPVQVPVSQFTYWTQQILEAGPAYDVLAAKIEESLIAEGYLEVS